MNGLPPGRSQNLRVGMAHACDTRFPSNFLQQRTADKQCLILDIALRRRIESVRH